MSWDKELLNEVRDDVKYIRERLPHLATKEEVANLKTRVDKQGFIISGVAWVGGIAWAFFQFIWKHLPHG